MPDRRITGSMLHDLSRCEHRVHLDVHGDPEARDPVSPFVQMLWRAGSLHEDEMVARLAAGVLDLRDASPGERAARTTGAMSLRVSMIVGGEISAGDLVGRPDLLRLCEDGTYTAGDVKLGAAAEGAEGGALRRLSYGLQVALYTDILQQNGAASVQPPFIIDGDGEMIDYPLDEPAGAGTMPLAWAYADSVAKARRIVAGSERTLPALSAQCKLCHWKSVCRAQISRTDDLTRIPQLGRSLRDRLVRHYPSVAALATAHLSGPDRPKLEGVGPARLQRFQDRARLLTRPDLGAYLRRELHLPAATRELFYDVEVDPMRAGGITYLHGILERTTGPEGGSTERFHALFADAPDSPGERAAFASAWSILTADPTATIYYWSKYERTTLRTLQSRYPDVCAAEEVEALFTPPRAVDLLYDVVAKDTEWPLQDHSIKTIAVHLGFAWRDTDPSGAGSIEWYDRWIRTGDPALRTRIIEYNEDDCVATRWIRDALPLLPVGRPWERRP